MTDLEMKNLYILLVIYNVERLFRGGIDLEDLKDSADAKNEKMDDKRVTDESKKDNDVVLDKDLDYETILSISKPSRTTESPFQFIEEDPLIACVGRNGGTSDYDIFCGFAEAVDVIYQSVESRKYEEDAMVYPMAFSARHCIELGLKISIHELMDFFDFPKLYGRVNMDIKEVNKQLLRHDIKALTEVLVSLFQIDNRFGSYEPDIVSYLSDYYFDEKGDMFRYAKSRNNTPNLASRNIGHIGLTQLYKRFNKLFMVFKKLYYEVEKIYCEYKTKSYTAHLSRANIREISDKLPDKSRWSEDLFVDVKEDLKKEYNIRSRELSEAINIIQIVPEFSVKIGMEKKFRNIPEQELEDYKNLVEWYNEDLETQSVEVWILSLNIETLRKIQESARNIDKRGKNISLETWRCLFTFYLLAKDYAYAENLQDYYDCVIEKNYKKDYLVKKLIKKDNFTSVQMGMRMCGQKSYLKKIDFMVW